MAGKYQEIADGLYRSMEGVWGLMEAVGADDPIWMPLSSAYGKMTEAWLDALDKAEAERWRSSRSASR